MRGYWFLYPNARDLPLGRMTLNLADGAYVATWPNRGTLDDFVPAFPDEGATHAPGGGGQTPARQAPSPHGKQ